MVIKFKGQRKDNNEWVFGSLYIDDEERPYILLKGVLWITNSDGVDMNSVSNAFEVLPETVAQFVNQIDKNGNEIYKNDKVKIWSYQVHGITGSKHYYCNKTGIIIYKDSKFMIKVENDDYLYDFSRYIRDGDNLIEVIKNE